MVITTCAVAMIDFKDVFKTARSRNWVVITTHDASGDTLVADPVTVCTCNAYDRKSARPYARVLLIVVSGGL